MLHRFFIFLLTVCFSMPVWAQPDRECGQDIDDKSKKKYEQALELYNKKKTTEAIKILQALLEDEPDYPHPYYLMGMIAVKKENVLSMEKNFKKVYELCPDYPEPYLFYYLGLLEYSNDHFLEAMRYYQLFFERVEEKDDSQYDELVREANVYYQWSEFLGKIYSEKVPFSPKSVAGICTRQNEMFPAFTIDNSMVFFNRRVEMKNTSNTAFATETEEENKFMLSEQKEDGTFGQGYPLDHPFNVFAEEGFATLTADNRTIYYTVCNYNQQYFNCDVYVSHYKNGEWEMPKPAGGNVNTTNTWDSHPSITADGKYLYFASDRPGGFGGTDIWRVKQLPGGDWGRPENLGAAVNSPGNEKTPFIHPDGQTLYFSSNGWKGVGGYDIFYIRLNNKQQKYPTNIGYPINTEDDEIGFSVSTVGEKAYITSNKYTEAGDFDIFEFDLYENAQPEKVTLVKGTLTNENGEPTDGKIVFMHDLSEETIDFPANAETGKYTGVVHAKNNYMVIAKKDGYAYDSRFISKDSLRGNSFEANLQIKPIEVGGSYQLKDINFTSNSSELSDEARFVMDVFVDFLRENPTIHVVIQGHTDNVGSSTENMTLSEARAKAVYNYLIEKRIRQERIQYKGYGATQPIASNATEEGRAQNRRTIFVITRK